MKSRTILIAVSMLMLLVPIATTGGAEEAPISVEFVIDNNGTTEEYDFVIQTANYSLSVEQVFLQVCYENNLSYDIIKNSFLTQESFDDYYVNYYCDEISMVSINGTNFTKWSNETDWYYWDIYITDNLIFDMDAEVRTNHRVTFEYAHATLSTDPDIDAEIRWDQYQEHEPEETNGRNVIDFSSMALIVTALVTVFSLFIGIFCVMRLNRWEKLYSPILIKLEKAGIPNQPAGTYWDHTHGYIDPKDDKWDACKFGAMLIDRNKKKDPAPAPKQHGRQCPDCESTEGIEETDEPDIMVCNHCGLKADVGKFIPEDDEKEE